MKKGFTLTELLIVIAVLAIIFLIVMPIVLNVFQDARRESFFVGATSFNQDLSSWCVSKISTQPSDFDFLTHAWTLPKPVWGTCP